MTDGLILTVTGEPGFSFQRYLVAWPKRARPLGSTQLTTTTMRAIDVGITVWHDAIEYSRRFIGEIMRTMSWKDGCAEGNSKRTSAYVTVSTSALRWNSFEPSGPPRVSSVFLSFSSAANSERA